MPVKPRAREIDWVGMKTVGRLIPAMPLPVFEQLDYLTEESISFIEEPYVQDFLEIKILKKDQIDEMIEEGLEEIWGNPFAQEVLNTRINDLNDMTVE